MSYARIGTSGEYIYSNQDNDVVFGTQTISRREIDVFLYKLLLSRPDELRDRVLNGRKSVHRWLDHKIYSDAKFDLEATEEIEYKQWLEEKENSNQVYKDIIDK